MSQAQAKEQEGLAVLRIDPDIHHRLKVESVRLKRQMSDVGTEAVAEWLRRHEQKVREITR